MIFTDQQITDAYHKFSANNRMSKTDFNLAIQSLIKPNEDVIPVKVITKTVIAKAAKVFDITEQEIIGKCREKQYVKARMFISFYLRTHGFSYKHIGLVLHKDHSSIIHHVNTFKDEIKFNDQFRDDYTYFQSINL